jgi:hypothetical protein
MRALTLVGLAVFFSLAACTSEENPTPPTNTFKVDSGTVTDTGVADTGEVVVDTGTPDANCFGDAGCFACEPKNTDQFLNQCSGSQCSKFDDKTRIPSSVWDGGALPTVP